MRYCDKCNNPEVDLYYCTYCEKNYCSCCTLDEPHEKNYMTYTVIKECNQIHEIIRNSVYTFDMSTEDEEIHMRIYDMMKIMNAIYIKRK